MADIYTLQLGPLAGNKQWTETWMETFTGTCERSLFCCFVEKQREPQNSERMLEKWKGIEDRAKEERGEDSQLLEFVQSREGPIGVFYCAWDAVTVQLPVEKERREGDKKHEQSLPSLKSFKVLAEAVLEVTGSPPSAPGFKRPFAALLCQSSTMFLYRSREKVSMRMRQENTYLIHEGTEDWREHNVLKEGRQLEAMEAGSVHPRLLMGFGAKLSLGWADR